MLTLNTKGLSMAAAILIVSLSGCSGGTSEGESEPASAEDNSAAEASQNEASPDGQADYSYNVAMLGDFSGQFADIWPDVINGNEAVLAWWNETVGQDMDVEIAGKTYDHRYDPSQIASLWPGVLGELDPIFALGVGGAEAAALGERLPDDEVPLFLSTAAYGYAWQPGSWVFNPRPTYTHEFAAFLEWYKEEQAMDALTVGMIASDVAAAYVDMHEGVDAYAETVPSIEYVGVEYADVQPVDLSNQVRRLLSEDVDVIIVGTNTTQAAAVVNALGTLGADDVAVVVSSHNSLAASTAAVGDPCAFQGEYEVFGMAIPAEEEGDAFEFYSLLQQSYGLESDWYLPTVQGMQQMLYSLRIVEEAVEAVGAGNLDGAAVYDAARNATIPEEETFSLLSPLTFTPEAPFPSADGLTVNVGTIGNECGYVVAAENVAVPAIDKW